MEQKNESSTGGLENQLRGMILGNVNAQAANNTQSTRGRGRGRGHGHARGGRQDRPVPGQDQLRQIPPPSPGLPGRGGPSDFRGRGNRQNGLQHAPASRQGSGAVQGGPTPRGGGQAPNARGRGTAQIYQPKLQGAYQSRPHANQPKENPVAQREYLDRLAAEEIPRVEMSSAEMEEKESFRAKLEGLFSHAFKEGYPPTGDIESLSLVGFGSLASGFGMPGSDMDLAVVPEWKNPSQAEQIGIDRDIPRLLEQAVLDAKMGGRLLTRTRVPILKVCQSPTEELFIALCEERKKWDGLPEAEQYPKDAPPEPSPQSTAPLDVGEQSSDALPRPDNSETGADFPELGAEPKKNKKAASKPRTSAQTPKTAAPQTPPDAAPIEPAKESPSNKQQQQPRTEKAWLREKVLGPLDFPKEGVGIQCDINFENPLGIHNTHMLRCYSLTDPRVRPLVLFVKSWAKRRKINSSYSGTLSSYGWVLMVLHYLVNIAQPPVCPNLQLSIPPPKDIGQLESFFKDPTVAGYTVRFWRNEQEIMQAARLGKLTKNRQSVGDLLRGFFQYYASLPQYSNYGPRAPQFYWMNEVLSLRTPGGIRTKQDKGWVSAKTTITAEKKVTNRYLFAIEDPFELDHNVARTVTHRGIVAIRDEFRRTWRILSAIGKDMQPSEGGIFDEVIEATPPPNEEAKKMGKEDLGVKDGEGGVDEAAQKADKPT